MLGKEMRGLLFKVLPTAADGLLPAGTEPPPTGIAVPVTQSDLAS
jgi:hypothetical protein